MCDPTNGVWIREIGTTTYVKPALFNYGKFYQKPVYISYEEMMRDLSNPFRALCYDFDEDGNLGIYYMDRTGPVANYKCEEFSTDENGKLLQNNGFVTWKQKVETETGYEIWLYEGYSCQGYTIGGTQTINGVTYEFPRERDMTAPIGYAKEKLEIHYDIGEMERTSIESSYTYTGDYICPEIVITNGDKILEKDVDYTVSYYNNKDISTEATGQAYFVVEGIGEYYDRYPVYYDIVAKEITEADVSYSQEIFQYSIAVDEVDGFAWPDVTVNAPKEDYTVSCSGFGHYGTGTVVVQGRYNCTGRVEKVFQMQPISFESGAFKVSLDTSKTYEYYEMAWEPKVTVTWYREDGSVYRELSSAEYDVTYENNQEVGTAKVIVEGDGHFTGKLETSFEIVRKDISEDIQLKQALSRTWKAHYTGEAVIPTIPGINYFNEYILDTGYVLDEDYTMTVTDNVNAGTGTITLEGIGNYTGSMTQTFTIAPKEITQEELYVKEKTVAYTGEVIEPEVVAGELVPGVDFRVSCYRKEYDETGENYEYVLAQPQEVGVYFLKVELLNPNYLFWYSETEKEMTYYIEAVSVIPPGSGDTGNTGNEDGNTNNGGNTDSNTSNSSGGNTDSDIGNSSGGNTDSDIGNSGGTGNDTSNSNGGNAGNDTGNGGGTSSGTESGGTSGSTAGDTSNAATGDTSGNAADGTTSEENNSSSGNSNEENRKVSRVTKLKLKKQKSGLLVQWKKVKNIQGYQLQYSTNKKFKKAKSVYISSKNTSYKLKKVKKKSTYYIRIRAYQTYKDSNGKTMKVYGKWSAVKKKKM